MESNIEVRGSTPKGGGSMLIPPVWGWGRRRREKYQSASIRGWRAATPVSASCLEENEMLCCLTASSLAMNKGYVRKYFLLIF